jgi:hypothetical protein
MGALHARPWVGGNAKMMRTVDSEVNSQAVARRREVTSRHTQIQKWATLCFYAPTYYPSFFAASALALAENGSEPIAERRLQARDDRVLTTESEYVNARGHATGVHAPQLRMRRPN